MNRHCFAGIGINNCIEANYSTPGGWQICSAAYKNEGAGAGQAARFIKNANPNIGVWTRFQP
jgi:hypothetical protein